LLNDFSKIKDPRNPKKIKHKIAVLMMLGLFQFIFRIKSRRSFNEQLTTPCVFKTLSSFFPEVDSIPHSETVARLLSRMDVLDIERSHIKMIKRLIDNKKFQKALINKCYSISIDGTQKAVRSGQHQEEGWLLRTVTKTSGKEYQQYVYVLEANLTFSNGLNIPLLTEYCFLDIDSLTDAQAKQDCELNAFYRLTDKLKKYFPRLKMMFLLDNLYACDTVISYLEKYKISYMIKLPAKLKYLYEILKSQKESRASVPGMEYFRERKQKFYWLNDVTYKDNTLHLVSCVENWKSVSPITGEIINEYSEHTWISSEPLSLDNVHERCNLAARKRALIEDNFNTEKNRGYCYQHIFSYCWEAMKGFHYLMRLAHAINAISEFTKKLKKYIRDLGWSNTLMRIFDAIKNPWLTSAWIKKEMKKNPQLRLDLKLE
jgi:hypothetical protein